MDLIWVGIVKVTVWLGCLIGILVMVGLMPFIILISQYPREEAIKRYQKLMLLGKIGKPEENKSDSTN